MQSKVDRVMQFTITMSEREAAWLKAVSRNSLLHAKESSHENYIRKSFFEAVEEARELGDMIPLIEADQE